MPTEQQLKAREQVIQPRVNRLVQHIRLLAAALANDEIYGCTEGEKRAIWNMIEDELNREIPRSLRRPGT